MKILLASSTLLLAIVAFSSTVHAAEAVVTWQNPESYTDIKSDDGDQQEFQSKLFGILDEEFSRHAKEIKNAAQLAVTVTNFDMAGELEIMPGGSIMRIVKDQYYPQMTLDYTITDASGAVLSQQKGVTYKDQGFFSADASLRSSQSSNDFYYETTLVRDWFASLKHDTSK